MNSSRQRVALSGLSLSSGGKDNWLPIGLRYKEVGIRPSMGSLSETYTASLAFIEGWNNPGQRHLALSYKSTNDYGKIWFSVETRA